MSRLILRPLFILVTLALLVMAFFQVAGRLMFAVLDELEVGINQWLAPQQVIISGLTGDWHWINPVVRIERIDLPAGHLTDIELELDWLESLVRNRLIASGASLSRGHLLLEQTESGWRLAGATSDGPQFNPIDTLYHSDQIDISLTLGFIGEDGSAQANDELLIEYLATNRGGQHRHRLAVGNPGCNVLCEVEFSLDEAEAIPFLRQRLIEARLSGNGLRIPEPLLAGDGGRLVAVNGSWWRRESVSGGTGYLRFADLAIDDDLLGGGFELAARGEGDTHHLELKGLHLESGDTRWQLPGFWLTLESGAQQSTLSVWTERIETGSGFQFLAALAPQESAVFRWLNALNVQATALNVHGFVRFPGFESGYLATVRDVSLDGYNGAPWLRGAGGELLGANRSIQLLLNVQDVGIQFPDMFRQRWVTDHVNGRLRAYVSGEYFGLKGSNLRAELDGSRASVGFALSRPTGDYYGERLSLLVNVDQMTVEDAKQYIPYRLPAGLPEWLDSGPRQGRLQQVAFAYHGQIHTRPFELARRVEFAAQISDGSVQYHPDWPVVNDLSGLIAVAGRDVKIQVDEGRSFDATDLSGSRIRLGDNASYADIDLVSDSSVDEALTFIRSTPLADWMGFVTPDWAGEGPLRMTGRLLIPLKLSGEHIGETSMADALEVDLNIELFSADLDLPGYGVALGELAGDFRYQYPHGVSGSDVRGRIFNRPAIFGASADADTVVFHVDGQAPYEEVLTLLDVADPGIIRGGFDFNADLHIELGDAVSRLDVVSDLTGLALELPGEFAKAPDEPIPAELQLSFLEAYQAVQFRYGSAQGWLHVNEALLRGAIGFAAPPPLMDPGSDRLVLSGRIGGFSLDQVVPDGGGGPSLSIPLTLADLQVDLIDVNGIGFRDAVLSGQLGRGSNSSEMGIDLELAIDSPDLAGRLTMSAEAPLALNLTLLRLPESNGEPGEDPLDSAIIADLVDADIRLESFLVGGTDYGAWSFNLRPEGGDLVMENLTAELRGVTISADRLFWNGLDNRTSFEGELQAGDLAEVLPQWGYAASVTTEHVTVQGKLSWQGSPAAVDLELLVGQAAFQAENGRFLDVTSGADAMKIFSLVNFSTIAKRLNFDFSDVVGEGVSFDSLTATTEFQAGTMQFIEPMAVDGSGSNFRIAGRVDLVEGQLDNEMIVTLPVTKGLPWYAAYIALANPLAGLGVLVGERVFRKPLEQFSSAKYQISGTLEEPELKFVSVWDTSMDKPQDILDLGESETPAADTDESEREAGEKEVAPAGEPASVEEATAQNTGSTTG